MAKQRTETQIVIGEMIAVWNHVYAEALKVGPHNPKGTHERAEQLTRAYMSGVLRIEAPYAD